MPPSNLVNASGSNDASDSRDLVLNPCGTIHHLFGFCPLFWCVVTVYVLLMRGTCVLCTCVWYRPERMIRRRADRLGFAGRFRFEVFGKSQGGDSRSEISDSQPRLSALVSRTGRVFRKAQPLAESGGDDLTFVPIIDRSFDLGGGLNGKHCLRWVLICRKRLSPARRATAKLSPTLSVHVHAKSRQAAKSSSARRTYRNSRLHPPTDNTHRKDCR